MSNFRNINNPTKDEFFCALESRNGYDEQVGTASYIRKLLLIEYKQPLKEEAFEYSDIPTKVKIHIEEFLNSDEYSRILLIRNPEQEVAGRYSIYGINCIQPIARIKSRHFAQYEDLLSFNFEVLFDEDLKNQKNEILYLICTNGKKDKCCSKFGIPIFNSFQKHRPINTWQCSHLGGDRFAPTMIALPSCTYYGHIIDDDVLKIISAEERRRIYLPKYRGQTFYNFFEQAAIYFIRNKLDMFELTSLEVLESHKIEQNKYKVIAESLISNKHYRLLISRSESKYFNYLSCKALRKTNSFKFSLESFETVSTTKS